MSVRGIRKALLAFANLVLAMLLQTLLVQRYHSLFRPLKLRSQNYQMEFIYLLPFNNNYRDHDFSLISDTIKEYFPIGNDKRLTSEDLAASPGFKKISKIVDEEFLDQIAYTKKWGKLTSNLEKVFKDQVYGNASLSGGAFFGEVTIEEDKNPHFIRKKTLRFYVSILGPFFAIHGMDSSIALLEIEPDDPDLIIGNFEAIHAITTSPAFEYQESFSKLEYELRSFFPGYLFVPYDVGMSTIRNISVADELRDPRSFDTIYEGLFGLDAVHDSVTRGDKHYGMNDWVKPLNREEKSLIDLISRNIIAVSHEITVHKVWKLQESKQLESFKVSGNLMFGMDLFDIIDLTDKSTFIMTVNGRGAPSTGKYSIKNDVIEIDPKISLRIIELSKTSLILHLILNFEHGGVPIKGEAMELKFVQMKSNE